MLSPYSALNRDYDDTGGVEVTIIYNKADACFDIDPANGVKVILKYCACYSSTQSWSLRLSSDGTIRSLSDLNKCLAVQSGTYHTGKHIEVEECDPTKGSQVWTYEGDGSLRNVGDLSYCIRGTKFDKPLRIGFCSYGSNIQSFRLVGLGAPTPSPTFSYTPTEFRILTSMGGGNAATQYCLDVPNAETKDDVDLFLRFCDFTSRSQLWFFHTDGSIRSALNDRKCIGIYDQKYSSDKPIQIQDCVSIEPSQMWTFEGNGSATAGPLQSKGDPTYCFNENRLGAVVFIGLCDGSSTQDYLLVEDGGVPSMSPSSSSNPVGPPTLSPTLSYNPDVVPIVSYRGNYCLGLQNDGIDTPSGIRLILELCQNTTTITNTYMASHLWSIHTGDSTIRPMLNESKCLGIEGGIYDFQTPIELQDCIEGNTAQQWTFVPSRGFGYFIKSVGNPNYCFDENGLGNEVYIEHWRGWSEQYFNFEVV